VEKKCYPHKRWQFLWRNTKEDDQPTYEITTDKGNYQLQAEINYKGETVTSSLDMKIE